MTTEIKQQHYGTLQVDTSEKDIVQIWNAGELVQIEREHLERVIELLNAELKK